MAFSARFFCQSGQPHSLIQYLKYRFMIKIEVAQHHHEVKPEVSDLMGQRVSVARLDTVLCREDHLGGLFTDLFQNLVESRCVE